MTFRWRYLTSDSTEVDGPPDTFDDQGEAETWLTDNFAELAEAGVDAVTLLDSERPDPVVYGPMSLHAES